MLRERFSLSKTAHGILKIINYMFFDFKQTCTNFRGLLISKLSPTTAENFLQKGYSANILERKLAESLLLLRTRHVCLDEGIYLRWGWFSVLPLKRCFSQCLENTNAVHYSLCPFTFSIITVVLWKYHYFLIRTGK